MTEWNQVGMLCWKDFQYRKEKKENVWINSTDWRRQPSFSQNTDFVSFASLQSRIDNVCEVFHPTKKKKKNLHPRCAPDGAFFDSSLRCVVRLNLDATGTKSSRALWQTHKVTLSPPLLSCGFIAHWSKASGSQERRSVVGTKLNIKGLLKTYYERSDTNEYEGQIFCVFQCRQSSQLGFGPLPLRTVTGARMTRRDGSN